MGDLELCFSWDADAAGHTIPSAEVFVKVDGVQTDGVHLWKFDANGRHPWDKTTADCLRILAQLDVSCVSFLSGELGSSSSACIGLDVDNDWKRFSSRTSCGCNPAIRELMNLTSDGCEPVNVSTYGCEMPDDVVDKMRIETIRRYKAAFSLPREEFSKELNNIFTSDATYTILGLDTYRGIDAIIEGSLFMNPLVADDLLVSGYAVALSDLTLDSNGMRSGAQNVMFAHGLTTKFVQGSYSEVEFLSCSGMISSIFLVFDDFSFTAIIVKPPSIPRYSQLDSVPLPKPSYSAAELSADQIKLGKEWAYKFYDVGTHDCINGMWNKAVYFRTWQSVGDTGVDCLVLGKGSYLKLYPSDVDGYADFSLLYEHPLKTIRIKGTSRFEVTTSTDGEEVLAVGLLIDGRHLGAMDIPLNASNCINLWMLKYCGSWKDDDLRARRLEGSLPQLKVYMEVEHGDTESITIWDPNVNTFTATSTTTPPLGNDWKWSASLSGPIAALSSLAIRYV
jgi:hypothetical protein